MPVRDVPQSSAACSIRVAGTPVTRAPQAGVYSRTASAAASKPSVCAAMKPRSSQPRATSTWRIVPMRAESVPGRSPRKTSAVRASGVTRGSATISLAPRSRACHT